MMQLTDHSLEQVIYAALRRCDHVLDDSVVAERVATAIIRAEALAPANREPEA